MTCKTNSFEHEAGKRVVINNEKPKLKWNVASGASTLNEIKMVRLSKRNRLMETSVCGHETLFYVRRNSDSPLWLAVRDGR